MEKMCQRTSKDILYNTDFSEENINRVLNRFPAPLHTPGKVSYTTPFALFEQMSPLLLDRNLNLFPEESLYVDRVNYIESLFSTAQGALLLLRKAFPTALQYLQARARVLETWKSKDENSWATRSNVNFHNWWEKVSEENGIKLFGPEQWKIAKFILNIKMIEANRLSHLEHEHEDTTELAQLVAWGASWSL